MTKKPDEGDDAWVHTDRSIGRSTLMFGDGFLEFDYSDDAMSARDALHAWRDKCVVRALKQYGAQTQGYDLLEEEFEKKLEQKDAEIAKLKKELGLGHSYFQDMSPEYRAACRRLAEQDAEIAKLERELGKSEPRQVDAADGVEVNWEP